MICSLQEYLMISVSEHSLHPPTFLLLNRKMKWSSHNRRISPFFSFIFSSFHSLLLSFSLWVREGKGLWGNTKILTSYHHKTEKQKKKQEVLFLCSHLECEGVKKKKSFQVIQSVSSCYGKSSKFWWLFLQWYEISLLKSWK